MSDRQENGRPKTKKKFRARPFLSRITKRNDDVDVSIEDEILIAE
jgi:hypothetical protein